MNTFIIHFLKRIFGTQYDRDIRQIKPLIEEINREFVSLKSLTDNELCQKTGDFKKRIITFLKPIQKEIDQYEEIAKKNHSDTHQEMQDGGDNRLEQLKKKKKEAIEEILNDIMPEAFAVIKETCRRFCNKKWMVAGNEVVWDMIPYDVQLMGAIAMHQGKIAEMKTGEGKTLSAIFPAYLNALVGEGVHIVTVNDYLSKRDREWNAPLFEFHGLKVDCIDCYSPHSPDRKQAYLADITYGTNNEFGFDYLRDNMVGSKDELVQRQHHYAIIDEVDSILIDEARTPLIISGPIAKDTQAQKYSEMQPRVEKLVSVQKNLIASYVRQAQDIIKENNKKNVGLLLLRAQRGFPKNRQFQKLMENPVYQRLVVETEAHYLRDNAREFHLVDEPLYYSVDQKQQSIEMTDKGRDFITHENEDEQFFVVPDIGEEIAMMDNLLKEQKTQEINTLFKDEEFGDDYKNRQKKEIESKFRQRHTQELNRIHTSFGEKNDRIHTVNQLLKAYTLFNRDDEYIVQDGKVQIVDVHTGRVLSGRRYSDGLHQAIEAKERVKIERTTQTYATITLQNYFRMYHKLAGMTGTAETEEAEFNKIYKLDVVVIPTHKPLIRKDHEDVILRTKREKYNRIIAQVKDYHDRGQPVLIGTTSVETSELISRMLKGKGVKHNVLNARHHDRESEVVAQAGQCGAVTVATNMAGRGTDIKLAKGVTSLGGLAIIGTERHESRRIDLQLRGRSGRQGDPGVSHFYVSAEDNLMRIFGSDRMATVMQRLKIGEGEIIQHSWITKSLERAQKKVEQNNFSIRKHQLEYDDVLNNQRNVIYKLRKHALLGTYLRQDIISMLYDLVENMVEEHYEQNALNELPKHITHLLAFDMKGEETSWKDRQKEDIIESIIKAALNFYQTKSNRLAEDFYNVICNYRQDCENQDKEVASKVMFPFSGRGIQFPVVVDVQKGIETKGWELIWRFEERVIIMTIDQLWMEHLRNLDAIKEGIGLRSFGQKNPLLEYKKETFQVFSHLIHNMNLTCTNLLWSSYPKGKERMRTDSTIQQRSMIDPSKLQAKHDSSMNMGHRGEKKQSCQSKTEGHTIIRTNRKIGPNEMVVIQHKTNQTTQKMKWKKAQKHIEQGDWIFMSK